MEGNRKNNKRATKREGIGNRKKTIRERIKTTLNERNLVFSESICQAILEKIITLVIRESNKNLIYDKLTEYCLNYFTERTNDFMSICFIAHEDNKNGNINEEITNTWVEVEEPNIPEISRDHISKMKLVKESIQEINNDFDNNIKKDTQSNNKNHNYSKRKYNLNRKIKLNKCEEPVDTKPKKIPIVDMPYTDLPKEEFINIYDGINSELKEKYLKIDKENEIIDKELREKNEAIQERLRKELLKRLWTKEIDSSKLSFDSNGKIVHKRIPNVDFFPNEFTSSYSKLIDSEICYSNRSSKEKKKMKNNQKDIIIKEQIGNNNMEEVIKNKINKEENEEKESKNKMNVISKFKKLKLINDVIYNIKEDSEKIEYSKLKDMIPISGSNFDLIVPETGVIIHQDENEKRIKEGGFNYYNRYKKHSLKDFNNLYATTSKLNQELYSSALTSGNLSRDKKDISSKNNTGEEMLNNLKMNYIGYSKEFKQNNPLIYKSSKLLPKNYSNDKIIKRNNNSKKSLIKNRTQFEIMGSQYNNLYNSFDNNAKNSKYNLYNNIKLSKGSIETNLYHFLSRNEDSKGENGDNEKRNEEKINLTQIKLNNLSGIYKSTDNIKNNKNLIYQKKKNNLFNINKISILPIINNNNDKYGKDFINKFNEKIINNKMWGNTADIAFTYNNAFENQNFFRKSNKNTLRDLKRK